MFKLIAGVCTGLGIFAVLVALILPSVRFGAGPAARRSQCLNNLQQIALALHNYHAGYNALPPAYTVDADGKPLHSWRTLILPMLDEQALYDRIDLSKPWNDPANAEAYSRHPSNFHCRSADCPESYTPYLAIVAPDGCIRPGASAKLSEITDNHEKTLLVIEVPAEHAVHWMAPVDADERLVTGFGPKARLNHEGGMNTTFVSGRAGFLELPTTAADLRAMTSIAGNDSAGNAP